MTPLGVREIKPSSRSGIQIINNTFIDCGTAIAVDGAQGIEITGNTAIRTPKFLRARNVGRLIAKDNLHQP